MKKVGKRPRHRVLSSAEAITAARNAFREKGDFQYLEKVESEFMELDLVTVADRHSAVDDCLSQICERDRQGPQPPKDISVPPYGGAQLYAFTWKSKDLGPIYFKFCLAGVNGLELLVLHSFHQERPKDEK